MPYAADHKDKTRARIVDSARILFNRHGFESVSIDDVMKNAGLTRGGFYHHFAASNPCTRPPSAASPAAIRLRNGSSRTPNIARRESSPSCSWTRI